MAGLLDFLNSPEAQLGIGLLAYSGDMGRPMGFGERIAGAIGSTQKQQQAAEEKRLRAGLLQAQMTEAQAQAQQRSAEVAQAQRKQGALSTGVSFGEPMASAASAGQGGMAPGMSVNAQHLMLNGWTAKEIHELASLQNLGRQEVARTVNTVDAQGRPVTGQYDKFGGLIGEALPEWKAPVAVNQGDRTTFIDQTNLKPMGSFNINMSAGERASNALGWANNSLSRQRFAAEQQDAATKGQQYDADRGMVVNTRTGQAIPVMQGGTAIGAKDKGLNEGQAKANLFGSRMFEAENVIQELAAKGVNHPSWTKATAERIPGYLGGRALEAGANKFVASEGEQQVEQAQRDFINAVLRRESGAAIAESEFSNARKQYFPAPGDSATVIAQKAKNRQLATAGMLAEVPAGKRTFPAPQAGDGGFKILGVR